MPIAQSDPYKVQEISHLKRQPRAAEALELLKRVALQVQPIMRKRQWTVRKLSEFVPKSNNLLGLNVNRGAEVKLRLRPPGQEDSFYPWEHVLGTMLHELCHNNIGPHNAGTRRFHTVTQHAAALWPVQYSLQAAWWACEVGRMVVVLTTFASTSNGNTDLRCIHKGLLCMFVVLQPSTSSLRSCGVKPKILWIVA